MRSSSIATNPFVALWLASQAENRHERDVCMKYARTAFWPDNRKIFVANARQRNWLAIRAARYAREAVCR